MEVFWAFVVGLVAGFCFTLAAFASHTVPVKSVIDGGYGLYCPEDGEFAFVEECSNE